MSDPWLAGPVTSTAYGWRLERRDGVVMGFTSHDHDVELDGLNYRASPGLVPTSISESLGLEEGGLDVKGALTADAIRADDLYSGRWDSARLEIFLFDWSDPAAGKRMLAVGQLGAISQSGDGFQAEFRGPAARLDFAVAPFTSPSCRAQFGDADCGLSRARFTHYARVATAAGPNLTLTAALPGSVDLFAFGQIRWLDGANCGLRSEIMSNSAANIALAVPPAFPIVAGARIELLEGCDRMLATCASRFANAINFRGEPHLPGNDLLTRYPGG